MREESREVLKLLLGQEEKLDDIRKMIVLKLPPEKSNLFDAAKEQKKTPADLTDDILCLIRFKEIHSADVAQLIAIEAFQPFIASPQFQAILSPPSGATSLSDGVKFMRVVDLLQNELEKYKTSKEKGSEAKGTRYDFFPAGSDKGQSQSYQQLEEALKKVQEEYTRAPVTAPTYGYGS